MSWQRALPAVPESVPEARRAMVRLAEEHGASEEVVADVALGVSEAMTNVVRHAYRGRDAPGEVQLSARVEGATLEVVVADDGPGLGTAAGSPDGLGLGLTIMEQVADDLHVVAPPGVGTSIRLTYVLG